MFTNTTIRQTVRLSLGADIIRLRLSNAFGPDDLPISAITVAQPVPAVNDSIGTSEILTETLQTVTFSGSKNFTIPDQSIAVSDPIHLEVEALSVITITMYLDVGQDLFNITSHPGSRTSSWLSLGNYVDAANLTDPSTQSIFHWYELLPSPIDRNVN